MPLSKSIFANFISVLYFTCFHYHCAASLILTLKVPGDTQVTIGIGKNRVRPLNDLMLLFSSDILSLVAHVPGQFEVVRVCCKTFLQALFFPLATSKLFCYIRSGPISDKSNSQISQVIALNPSRSLFSSKISVRVLIWKKKIICLCFRNFDGRKKLINRLVSRTFYWNGQRSRKRRWQICHEK